MVKLGRLIRSPEDDVIATGIGYMTAAVDVSQVSIGHADKNREIGKVRGSTDLTVLYGERLPVGITASCPFRPNGVKSRRVVLVVE